MIKAALFDLDGVILDTEGQYTRFWGMQFRKYYPDRPGLEHKIKGQTLDRIYEAWWDGQPDVQAQITRELDQFEQDMDYGFIPGVVTFVKTIRTMGIKTAIITSSNVAKMESVYRKVPALRQLFDRVLTSEDFPASKPQPDPYLAGAATFGLRPDECVGFEDSVNGLLSVAGAGMTCVGIATTLPREQVAALANVVVDDFTQLTPEMAGIGLTGKRL